MKLLVLVLAVLTAALLRSSRDGCCTRASVTLKGNQPSSRGPFFYRGIEKFDPPVSVKLDDNVLRFAGYTDIEQVIMLENRRLCHSHKTWCAFGGTH
jgi:hypothetical protein